VRRRLRRRVMPPRPSTRHRPPIVIDTRYADLEEQGMFLSSEEEVDGGNEPSLQRRSSRRAAQEAMRVLQQQADNSNNNDYNSFDEVGDVDGDQFSWSEMGSKLTPSQRRVRLGEVAAWTVAEAPSPQRSFYVPQVQDRVLVFSEGLMEYYRVFCPSDEMPSPEHVDGIVWKVTRCEYERHVHHVSRVVHCVLTLEQENKSAAVVTGDGEVVDESLTPELPPPLVLRYHPCEELQDFIVTAEEVRSSRSRIRVGLAVQAYFQDTLQWYAGRVVEIKPPRGWAAVAVRWDGDDSDAQVTWLHPWEVFPISDPLGVIGTVVVPLERRICVRARWMLIKYIRAFLETNAEARVYFREGWDVSRSAFYRRGEMAYAIDVQLVLKRLW
jgi:hypothetical protein